MSDYSQGKIYILKSKNTEDVYIGSTKGTLEERFYWHMMHYHKWLRTKKNYCTSFEIIKHKEPYIEKLEDYPCESREELRKKEGEYQLKIECVNKNIAGRTKKEWDEDNKQHIHQYNKEYYSRPDVIEQRKEYRKEYEQRPEVKEKAKDYRTRPEVKQYMKEYNKQWIEINNEYHKEWEQKNKVKRSKQKKEYYQKVLKQKGEKKMKCVCGVTVRCDNKRRHEKSRKHIKYIEEMKEKGDTTNINEFIEQVTSN